jgi:riboflavin kinase/FMN adenylyltransferase
LLGRPFSFRGAVASGQGIGAKQTVPTLNLQPTPGLVLPRGVFTTETLSTDDDRLWPSITNVGTRPTFSGHELTIETFLLNPLTGDSPANIEVRFHRFMRSERRFENAAELKSQILRDVARAKEFWRKLDILQG